jgi:hypothetical protein
MKRPRLKKCKGKTVYGEPCCNYVSLGDYCSVHHPMFKTKSTVKTARIKPERILTAKYPYHRRYVYPETYQQVMEFAVMQGLHSPNNKDNFAYSLQEYIKWLKEKALDIKDNHQPKV